MDSPIRREGRPQEHRSGHAFQVIVLGGGGGPSESDTTGILVRSTSTQWTKSSILAVDAGVHLTAIEDIVRRHLPEAVKITPPPRRPGRFNKIPEPAAYAKDPTTKQADRSSFFAPVTEASRGRATSPQAVSNSQLKQNFVLKTGPFSNLMVPYESAAAIAAYMLRNLISTILITHPHLDHLSGFAINTAALQNTTRPKKIVALPHTIDAIKTHIFNDVIWPNMSDEEGGIGFVSYQRLVEGGHSALGDEYDAGYIEVCDGLAVKGHTVSHGHCMKRHKHRGSSVEPPSPAAGRRLSSRMGSHSGPSASSHTNAGHTWTETQHFNHQHVMSPAGNGGGYSASKCVVESSAFFIRDEETGHEVLIFGDVEPDSISEDPRNYRVWADAAPKIADGVLSSILIECSYDDSQGDAVLFGHLAPRHLVAELAVLASKVTAARNGASQEELRALAEPVPSGFSKLAPFQEGSEALTDYATKKKRRLENGSRTVSEDVGSEDSPRRGKQKDMTINTGAEPTRAPPPERAQSGISPMSSPPSGEVTFPMSRIDPPDERRSLADLAGPDLPAGHRAKSGERGDGQNSSLPSPQIVAPKRPLDGVRVVIIHVKDPLKDNHDPREVILRQCRDHEQALNLGCEFVTCKRGDSIWI